MTLLDYITFMEDRNNIDTYVFVKKEKTILSHEEYSEDVTTYEGIGQPLLDVDGNTQLDAEGNVVLDTVGVETITSVIKTRPVETTTTEVYKYTFLENGGIKKELYTQGSLQTKLDDKQAEVLQIQSDISLVSSL